jgi:hypothetical protein
VLVATELDEWVEALDEAYRMLDRQLRGWSRPGPFAVVDTSVYIIDPAKLRDLDLAQLLDAHGEALLRPSIVGRAGSACWPPRLHMARASSSNATFSRSVIGAPTASS